MDLNGEWKVLQDFAGSTAGFLAGLGIGVIGVVATLMLGRDKRPVLAYRSTQRLLADIDAGVREHVQIAYKGKPVSTLYLCEITIANLGRADLPSEAFQGDIVIEFRGSAQVLSGQITEKQPNNLTVKVSRDGDKLMCRPDFLNRGDSFTMRMLADGKLNPSTPTGRIVGVKQLIPMQHVLFRRKLISATSLGLGTAVIAVMFFGLSKISGYFTLPLLFASTVSVMSALSAATTAYDLQKRVKELRERRDELTETGANDDSAE